MSRSVGTTLPASSTRIARSPRCFGPPSATCPVSSETSSGPSIRNSSVTGDLRTPRRPVSSIRATDHSNALKTRSRSGPRAVVRPRGVLTPRSHSGSRLVGDPLAARGRAVRGRIERDRRTHESREEGTMRQVTACTARSSCSQSVCSRSRLRCSLRRAAPAPAPGSRVRIDDTPRPASERALVFLCPTPLPHRPEERALGGVRRRYPWLHTARERRCRQRARLPFAQHV